MHTRPGRPRERAPAIRQRQKGKKRQRDLGDVKKDMVVLGEDFSHF